MLLDERPLASGVEPAFGDAAVPIRSFGGSSLVRVDRHFDLPQEAVPVAAEYDATCWDRAIPPVLTHPIAHLGNLGSECLRHRGVEVHWSSKKHRRSATGASELSDYKCAVDPNELSVRVTKEEVD